MDERIEKLTDDVTAGLGDDPELRLDVRQELRAHLQETAEQHQAAGQSADASVDDAIASFGAPAEIATGLEEANKRRMTLRAYARFTLKAVLPTLAVILAVVLGYGRLAGLSSAISVLPFDIPGHDEKVELKQLPQIKLPTKQLTADQMTRIISDKNGRDKYLVIQIVEAHRNQADYREYLGYYYNLTEDTAYKAEGEKADPDNAFYNYTNADNLLQKGINSRLNQTVSKEKPAPKNVILDSVAMDEGIREYLAGVAKPRYSTYQREMILRGLAKLPSPIYTEDYLMWLYFQKSMLLPQLSRNRNIARQISGCMEVLVDEGRLSEARALADSWPKYCAQIADENDYLINYLVAQAIAPLIGNTATTTYERLGLTAEAEHNSYMLRQVEEIRKRIGPKDEAATQKIQEISRYSSLIAKSIIPIRAVVYNNTPTIADFAPSRQHEQAVVSELMTNLLAVIILIIMLFGGLRAWILYFYQKKRTLPLPIMILPATKALLRIIGYGVLAPLVVYAIYIQMPFSGREYGLSYLYPRLTGEFILLALWLIFVPATLALREIRKRCASLAISMLTKEERVKRTWQIFLLVAVALVIWCSFVIIYRLDEYEYLSGAILVFLAVALFLFAWLYLRIDRKHGQYHGTVSRSLTPIYALVVIILAGIVQPILMYQEVNALHRDKIIFSSDNTVEFSPIETSLTKTIRADFLRAIEQDHPTPAGDSPASAK